MKKPRTIYDSFCDYCEDAEIVGNTCLWCDSDACRKHSVELRFDWIFNNYDMGDILNNVCICIKCFYQEEITLRKLIEKSYQGEVDGWSKPIKDTIWKNDPFVELTGEEQNGPK